MRHIGRSHGVSLAWLSEETREDDVVLRYLDTDRMAAYMFTKFFTETKRVKWGELRRLINVLAPDEVRTEVGRAGWGYVSASGGEGPSLAAAATPADLGEMSIQSLGKYEVGFTGR